MMFRVLVKSYYDSLWCIQDYYIITWIIAHDSIGWIPVLRDARKFIGLLKQHCIWIGLTKKLRQTKHGCFEINSVFGTTVHCFFFFSDMHARKTGCEILFVEARKVLLDRTHTKKSYIRSSRKYEESTLIYSIIEMNLICH